MELAENEIKKIGRCTEKQLQQAALRVGSELIHKQELECELYLAAGRAASQYVDHKPTDEKAADQAKIYFEKTVELSKAGNTKKIKNNNIKYDFFDDNFICYFDFKKYKFISYWLIKFKLINKVLI